MKSLIFAAALLVAYGGLAASANAQLVREPNTTLALPAELPSATSYTTENALGSLTFSSPIDVASPPSVNNRLCVIERNSGIQMVNLDTMAKSSFLALSTYLSAQGTPLQSNSENGILGMAFHPDYNQNGHFYLFYSININGQLHQRIARFTSTGTAGNYNNATSADPSTESPLITQRDQAGNHNGGDLGFGPDGYLYISVGDEGPQRDGADNARRIAKDFFGGILRIDVDQKPGSLAPNEHDESSTGTVGDSAITPGTYTIPADNPFVTLAEGSGDASYNGFTFPKSAIRTEFYAIGFRNPWRMSFDPNTGRLFVGDVGQYLYEEIDIVSSGFNGGWSWREGFHAHTPANDPRTPPAGFLGEAPIYEYDHSNDGSGNDAVIFGSSLTGGVVYRGDRLPELFGKYLFCDYNYGIIAALTEQEDGTWTGARLGSDSGISGFGYDPRDGDALLCDLSAGQIKRLTRSGSTGTPPPATLSATGAFSDLSNLTPNSGIVAYAPNVTFWSDYAIKSRWFSIKNTSDTVNFNSDSNWEFPSGMVWIKHFDFDTTRGNPATRRKLETRFLVKTESDVYGLVYKWRADQSDADLVVEEGLEELIPSSNPPQTWSYPSRSDCRACHTDAGGLALSFNSRQMNRDHVFGTQTLNQISALEDAGYFSGPAADPRSLPALAPADDASTSLEWRVRSYLEVNCAQCHQPGAAAPGIWDARSKTPTDLANLINGQLINDAGDPNNFWCVPGDTAHSMIIQRLEGDSIPRMPPLGTAERDLGAEALITEWINSDLPARQSFEQWQIAHFSSTSDADAQPEADPDGDGDDNEFEFLMDNDPLDPLSSATLSLSLNDGTTTITFDSPANRSALIETSTDFIDWSIWDIPANQLLFPSSAQLQTLSGQSDDPRQFFRLKVSQP